MKPPEEKLGDNNTIASIFRHWKVNELFRREAIVLLWLMHQAVRLGRTKKK
jgi:hypothetical protein